VPTGKVDGTDDGGTDKPTTSPKVRQFVRQATTITHVLFFSSTRWRFFSYLFRGFFGCDVTTVWQTRFGLLIWLLDLVSNLGLFSLLASRIWNEIFFVFKEASLEDGTYLDWDWAGLGLEPGLDQ
jgi:hypothetical protein